MAKNVTYYDRQHVQRLVRQQNDLSIIFNRFCTSVSSNLKRWTDTGNKSVWVRNLGIENAIDRELADLQSYLLNNIESYQDGAFDLSNKKNDDLINTYIQGMAIRQALKRGMFVRNSEALVSLQKRVDEGGMNLSERVWSVADQTKNQLEFYLKSGLSAGRSAPLISQDIRQLLNHPDMRFHRIRNEEGELVPSQPMKDYHPGQGQYKSSKMNALRLAATETNIAYRRSDHERWTTLDFILGIDIQRSPSAKEPCKICDPMAGQYPKDFMFTGWHPFCICFATPINMNPKDFANYLVTGHLPQSQRIKGIPQSAKDYINDNLDFINTSQPYWLQDNFGGNANNALA